MLVQHFDQLHVGFELCPTGAAWDADGDLDFIVVQPNDILIYFENVSSAAFVEQVRQIKPCGGIAAGHDSSPAVVDWDGDSNLVLMLPHLAAGPDTSSVPFAHRVNGAHDLAELRIPISTLPGFNCAFHFSMSRVNPAFMFIGASRNVICAGLGLRTPPS